VGCAAPAPRKTAARPIGTPGDSAEPPTPVSSSPPYHARVEDAKPFPKTLDPASFADRPPVAKAYRIAGAIPEVLAQQPCECHCELSGHRSLLDCFASNHGAG